LPKRGLPVWTTRLSGVRRLLPSQVLDLGRGEPVAVPLVAGVALPDGPDALLDLAARSMAGTMAAAARRFPLVVLLSGGSDSRVVLAACRAVADRVRFVTIDSTSVGGSAADARVARRLATELGLDHVVVNPSATPSAAFAALDACHTVAHDPLWSANNEALSIAVPPSAVGVTGHYGELWRGHAGIHGTPGRPVDADRYLELRHHTGDGLAEGPTRAWFAGADPHEVPVAHRAVWELDFGSRLAAWAEATDLVWADCLMPHGTRVATAAVLSLPERWRDLGTALSEELTRRLWPEALGAPILADVQHRLPVHRRVQRSVQRRVRRLLAS